MRRQRDIRLAVSILMAIAVAFLFPGMGAPGSLEPTDPPGATMHTLDEIYTRPIWHMFDKVFIDWPDNPRFAVCDNGTPQTRDDMVLDKETGLVWEREVVKDWIWNPGTLARAMDSCNDGLWPVRGGWRLPTVQELHSLVDWDHYNPALPTGHPIIGVKTGWDEGYWT